MHKLDFISGAPKTFIFQKESNKTNLGGYFTLILIIIILGIISSYLYGYFNNSKYTVDYIYEERYFETKDFQKIYYNETLYPKLNFTLALNQEINKSILITTFNDESIFLGESFEKNIADLQLLIYYKCKEDNCNLREEDKDLNNYNLFKLVLSFKGYYIDHENTETPLIQDEDYEEFHFSVSNRVDFYHFNWKIINYTEEATLSGIQKSHHFYGGEFTRPIKYSVESDTIPFKYRLENGENIKYKLVSIIAFHKKNFGYYDHYTRNKISIFDVIANICSLIITLYGIITFIFCSFYSNSFDNYKIIEKILLKTSSLQQSKKIIELKDINLDNDSNYNDPLNEINENNEAYKTNRSRLTTFVFKYWALPKYHFLNFFYNNIYTEKCCKSKIQKIISCCNDIISKYYSVDSVVYSQLRLENLFNDYKWNYPKLNNIENIDLINRIKKLSDT